MRGSDDNFFPEPRLALPVTVRRAALHETLGTFLVGAGSRTAHLPGARVEGFLTHRAHLPFVMPMKGEVLFERDALQVLGTVVGLDIILVVDAPAACGEKTCFLPDY